jgi:hypothetical protein
MPIVSSALRKKPQDETEDVSWAFRLMARWLGDAAREHDEGKTRVSLSVAEKIARSKLP